MIADTLSSWETYASLHPAFPAAFAFLRRCLTEFPPEGRISLQGDTLYASVQSYVTADAESGLWEAHRRYIDIQCVFSGTERIGWAALEDLTGSPAYSDADDCAASPAAENASFLTLTPGRFAVFYPQDAHMPGRQTASPEWVRKIVVKVAV